MAANKPIFAVDGTLLEGHSQMEHEDKLISRNWLEFLDCMQAAERDVEKLTLINQRICDASKEVKELYGNASASKMSGLESFIGSRLPIKLTSSHLNNATPKEVVNELRVEKRK